METNKVTMVSIEKLTPNPNNFYRSTDKDKLAMAASIKEDGLKVPITVTPDKTNPDCYIIISGHLRVLGSELAGVKEVPVIIEDYATEEEQLNALLLGNEYRTKTKREIANEMLLRKRIWAKKPGERTDLNSDEGGSTRTRLAERYKMSEANVGKYEAILERRPSLFDDIDSNEMSIDGAYNLIKYLESNGLSDLEDQQMQLTVVERLSPHMIQRVNEMKMPLFDAFYTVVKSLSKQNRPKVRKEGEEGDAELSKAKVTVKTSKLAMPKKNSASEEAEDSLPTHRCDIAECPCYGQLLLVVEEAGDSNQTETPAE